MPAPIDLAKARQEQLISVSDRARSQAINSWQQMDYTDLDGSWDQVGLQVAQQVTDAQLTFAASSDRYTTQLSKAYGYAGETSSIAALAFASVDGDGRDIAGILRGAVTTTKQAVGAGLGRDLAMQAGSTYLAAIVKTIIADLGRSADKVAGAGRGYTHYVRLVSGHACSRCAILAGIDSGAQAFKRHVSCQCTAVQVPGDGKHVPMGFHDSPDAYFESLSITEQNRIFTKAGAEAIRSGADPSKVVSARRAAKGIGYSSHGGARQPGEPRGHFVKTTIGVRPDGTPVQVYTTAEGTTVRGQFGRQQQNTAASRRQQGARYTSTNRVRLMPESIFEIAGDDIPLRQAFLRDAGYMDSRLSTPAEWAAQRRADRILVDRATLRFNNFTLG